MTNKTPQKNINNKINKKQTHIIKQNSCTDGNNFRIKLKQLYIMKLSSATFTV